jgi:hypothetical protein
MVKKATPLKPLREFNYSLVQEKLDGLLINVDRDLQRKVGKAAQSGQFVTLRCTELLNVMVRFASNSYHAAKYLMADAPEDPNRKLKFALTLPAVNRQLLDLLFTLVYMTDDFENRSREYQRAGWREGKEEYQRYRTHFANDSEWRPFFDAFKANLDKLEKLLELTDAERKNPSSTPYWKTPSQLSTTATKSRPFLKWLEQWSYGDTSAEAHLSFGGLFAISPFLVAELIGGDFQSQIENHEIHSYRYHQFSRTAIVALAISTEADVHLRLRNRDALWQLWKIFGEYSAEATEMFERRYESLLDSYS